jgi:hypothetical protein
MFSVFQCGRFGYKDSPHSHADMLHLDVSVGPDNYLIDPGTYVYTSNIGLRNDYRSQQRHNGPAFEGVKLAHPSDPFAWLQQPDCTVSSCYMGTRSDYICASYQLRHLQVGLADVKRSILFVHEAFWVVEDQIDLTRTCRLHWQFTTPCQITQLRDSHLLHGRFGSLAIVHMFIPNADIQSGIVETSFSEDYLHSRAGRALRFDTPPSRRIQAIFLMIPLQSPTGVAFEHAIIRNGQRAAIAFRTGNHQFIVSKGEGKPELSGLQTDAGLAVFARSCAGMRSGVLVNGSFLALDGEDLFRSKSPVDFADVLWQDKNSSVETSDCPSCILPPAESDSIISLKNLAS